MMCSRRRPGLLWQVAYGRDVLAAEERAAQRIWQHSIPQAGRQRRAAWLHSFNRLNYDDAARSKARTSTAFPWGETAEWTERLYRREGRQAGQRVHRALNRGDAHVRPVDAPPRLSAFSAAGGLASLSTTFPTTAFAFPTAALAPVLAPTAVALAAAAASVAPTALAPARITPPPPTHSTHKVTSHRKLTLAALLVGRVVACYGDSAGSARLMVLRPRWPSRIDRATTVC